MHFDDARQAVGERMCFFSSETDKLDALQELVEASLVQQVGAGRYRLYPLVTKYAAIVLAKLSAQNHRTMRNQVS